MLALERHRPTWAGPVWLEDVSSDDEAYWRLLARAWDRCRDRVDDLYVIEHDVVVHEQVFEQFDACGCTWCAFAYQTNGSVRPALGCSRFRHELIDAHPNVWWKVAELDPKIAGTRRHWLQLDVKLEVALWSMPHRHDPPVEHLHVY